MNIKDGIYQEKIEYIDGKEVKKVRKIIYESWLRCFKMGVDRKNGTGKIISTQQMEKHLFDNRELITVSKPIMQNIYSIVAGSGFSIILTNNEGCLLEVIGDKEIMEKANELNFIKGAIWTEEAVGTNAIGTCLYLNSPIQTIGEEHFCVNHHSWSCSAAPINDEHGNLLGCLNMSGSKEKAHIHTLGMVLTATFSIEKQLALGRSTNLINATFQSIHDGMLILDENNNINKINTTACEILNYTKGELLGDNINTIVNNVDFLRDINDRRKSYQDYDFNFYSKNQEIIKCSLKAVPIEVNKMTIGVVITFRKSSDLHKVANKVAGYKAVYKFEDIVTINAEMKKVIEYAKKAALTNCSILICGESGTGKELFAQSIHNYSSRAREPFIAVNCASIPRELMESELFGYEKGAFTGAAKHGRAGKFELADGGTIFLDEIGELPLDMQSKLLRVLDNKKIVRIGGNYEKKLDIRVIAATNRDLEKEITNHSFREDLYYRLNVMNINLIPLSKRKEDIEFLTRHFINRLNKELGQQKVPDTMFVKSLMNLEWRGNIRELQNIVERSYYLCDGNLLCENHISGDLILQSNSEDISPEIMSINTVEKNNIINALILCNGDVLNAAKTLDISRATIYRKIKKYNIKI